MDEHSSVSNWISQLKNGDEAATQKIWQRYVRGIVAFAHKKHRQARRRESDASDIAQESFEKFFRAAKDEKFSKLKDRHDLWQLLLVITERTAADHRRRENAARRPRLEGESVLFGRPDRSPQEGVAGVPSFEADPAFAVEASELFDHLMSLLEPALQEVVTLKMQGYTHQEIARRTGCVEATVTRRLGIIRAIWKQAMNT